MGDFDIKTPFITSENNEYTLEFSVSELGEGLVDIPIIEVSLTIEKRRNPTNSLKVFHYIAQEIQQYLQANDVILYYYCDSADIYYRNDKRRRFTSPQHFRSVFFNALFEKMKPKEILIKNEIIIDETHGNHYVSIIYKEKHKNKINLILEELETYQNK